MAEVPEPVPSGADSLRDLVRDQQSKKRRTRLVLFGILPIAAIGAGLAWFVLGKRAAERELADAWNGASACLVGAPLADGERASLRFRAIQLAAVHAERDKPDELRWPQRCADQAAALFEALRKHGREGDGGEQGLGHRAEQLALELRKAETMTDLSAVVDGAYDAAKALDLHAAPHTLGTPTPEPDRAPSLDTMPESAHISPLQYTLDRVTGTPMVDTEIHVLLHDPRIDPAAILCTFTQEGKDRCRKLGGELGKKSGLRLGGTTDTGASPLVLAGRDGEDGVYRSDSGEKIAAMPVHAAYSTKDGYVAIAGGPDEEDGRFELVQQKKPGAPLEKMTIAPGDFKPNATAVHRWTILWDRMVIQTIDDGVAGQAPHLHELALPAGEDAKPVSIVPLNWVNAPILGCRTADTLVARIGIERGYLTFHADSKWSTPVEVDYFARAMSCDKGEAVFTDLSGTQERCSAAGCQSSPGVGATFDPFKTREGAVADLSGKVLAVMLTDKGGVRYRLDAGNVLNRRGQDRLFFDDLLKDGALQNDSTVLGMVLLGRGRFAVALITTPKGVYALRFGADGKPTPANIDRKG